VETVKTVNIPACLTFLLKAERPSEAALATKPAQGAGQGAATRAANAATACPATTRPHPALACGSRAGLRKHACATTRRTLPIRDANVCYGPRGCV